LLLRAPVILYALGLGWVLDERFLLLRHLGRKTGLPRRTVLEILRHNEPGGCYIICSAWGEDSDWYKNLRRHPDAEIEVSGRRMRVFAVPVPAKRGTAELQRYGHRHPRVFRIIARIFTEPDRDEGTAEFIKRARIMALYVTTIEGSRHLRSPGRIRRHRQERSDLTSRG
jgi:deazaflavin-dependent oxidoreductase (nitroreductase family)